MAKNPNFRQKTANFVNGDGVIITLWRATVYMLVFLSILGLLWEYGLATSKLSVLELRRLDIFIASIFSIDYLTRFYASPKRGKFVINIFNIFDLIAILPTFVAGIDGFQVMRGARVIRALRVFRLIKIIGLVRTLDIRTNQAHVARVKAPQQIEFYHLLVDFYENLLGSKKNKKTNMAKLTSDMVAELNKKINKMAAALSTVDEDSLFHINFYELTRQLSPIIARLAKVTKPAKKQEADSYVGKNVMDIHKLRYLIQEMGFLLEHEAELGSKKLRKITARSIGKHIYLLLLLKSSLRDIVVVVTVAVCINLFIRFMDWDGYLAPALEYISFIEGAMGTLIILITSFNMKYTNNKRHATDLEVIDFMNFMTYYAGRIRGIVVSNEPKVKQQEKMLTEANSYIDSLGLSVIHGMRTNKEYKFDTGSLQILERLKFIVSKYQAKVDPRTYDKYEEMHGTAGFKLNKFQVLSSMRMPAVFNELNNWLIKGTYFLLIILSPLHAIPRVILMNLLQVAFFKVSQETDRASISNSLAGIPMEERILRRLCRVGAILNLKR